MGLLPRRRHRSAALNPTTPGLNHGSASAWPARPSSATKKKFGTVLELAALGLQPASSAPTGRHLSGAVGTTPSRASLCAGRSVPQPRVREGEARRLPSLTGSTLTASVEWQACRARPTYRAD